MSKKKLYIRFISPGTFVSEVTEMEVDSFDIQNAKAMARDVTERHGAKPFGFQFITKVIVNEGTWDQKIDSIVEGGTYYLGGELRSVEQVEADGLKEDEILLWNMKANGYSHVITNCNSYKSTFPFKQGIDKIV